jgi:hypothetical protein
MRVDEFAPALAAIAKGAQALGGAAVKGAQAVGGALAKTAQSAGSTIATGAEKVGGAVANKVGAALTGTPATPTGGAAQAQAQQAAPGAQQQTLGAVDIVNALKDPQVASQLKAMKQKMPGGNLDAMVDPKSAQDQQKQLTDLSKALDTLKKNAGIK